MENKKIIHWNVQLWKVYFYQELDWNNTNHKENMMNILTAAASEDMKLFMRFFLYVANTRNASTEIKYKFMCHFLGSMFGDIVLANIELIIKLGRKNDVLFFTPSIPELMVKWVNHKAKTDDDYKILLEGKQIEKKIDRMVYYKPKYTKNYKWQFFFEKIASDPTFNGIQTPISPIEEDSTEAMIIEPQTENNDN